MRRFLVAASFGAVALGTVILACDAFSGDTPSATSDASMDGPTSTTEGGTTMADAGPPAVLDEAGPPSTPGQCDSTISFKAFQPLSNVVNTVNIEQHPRLTPDELTLYINRNVTHSVLIRYRRAAWDQPWVSDNIILDPSDVHIAAWVSTDARRFYYDELGASYYHLLRADISDAGKITTQGLMGLNSGNNSAVEPYLSPTESDLWFASNRAGSYDLFHAVAGEGINFANVEPLGFNTTAEERSPVISSDGLTLYFSSDDGRGDKGPSIRMTTRKTLTDPFSPPIEAPGLQDLEDVTKGFQATPGWISPDNCRLYLSSTYNGGKPDIYVAWRN